MKKMVGILISISILLSMGACSSKEAANSKEVPGEVSGSEAGTSTGGFSWDMAKGTKLTVLLNQHTAANSINSRVNEFEKLTGIKVEKSILPESNYYDKLTISLSSGSEPDVFMCGPLMPWELAGANYIEDLTPYIKNQLLTNPDYDVDDFYKGVLGTFKWDKVAGHSVGEGPQWAMPMVFEEYVLGYNKRIFKEHNLKVPTTMDELLECAKKLKEFDGPGTYGLAIRGAREWPTITTSYITNFKNYGGMEFDIENGKLISKVNEEAGIKATHMYVDLIKQGGAPNWANYTWYECASDLGSGKAAMMFDADLVIYDQNVRDTKEAGNIAFAPAPRPSADASENSNIWGWGLSMNSASKQKTAAWLFIQYFTGKEYMKEAAVKDGAVNPARESVFNSEEFQSQLSKTEGYIDTFNKTIGGTKILSTPQPHFYETTAEWASTLQDIVNGKYGSVKEGMDALKKKMDKIVSDVDVSK